MKQLTAFLSAPFPLRLLLLIPVFLLAAGIVSCKSEQISSKPRHECELSSPEWSSPVMFSNKNHGVKLLVHSSTPDRGIIFEIYRKNEKKPLDTIELQSCTGQLSAEWEYDCLNHHRDDISSRPELYFIARYHSSNCSVKSDTILVGQKFRSRFIEWYGDPIVNKSYKLVAYSEEGEVIHMLSGKTDKNGRISHDDLIPCLKYRIIFR